jgi:hypothetical protein
VKDWCTPRTPRTQPEDDAPETTADAEGQGPTTDDE